MDTAINNPNKTVYLAIIWHQHQPLYADSEHKQLSAPWVRTHGTKDYYDMAAILREFPSLHCTFNLTSTLLRQLERYYIAPLSTFINPKTFEWNSPAEMTPPKGKKANPPPHASEAGSPSLRSTLYAETFPPTHTDPWIDMMLTPSELFGEKERNYLYRDVWSAISTSEVLLQFFPEYESLVRLIKNSVAIGQESFSPKQLLELKFWFAFAHFDADFLLGEVRLQNGAFVNLSDMVERKTNGKFYLRNPITESDCKRLVLETYKILSAIIPLHKAMQYDVNTGIGQLELSTTPYTHPILPLIHDSRSAVVCQPNDKHPSRFSFPEDAQLHVTLGVEIFKELFGKYPVGMWPSEGSVSQEILPLFTQHSIAWIATDEQILWRSHPTGQPSNAPYRVLAENSEIGIFFRNTRLSDKIGFDYQSVQPEQAAEDFIQSVLSQATENGQLTTVIIDGENAWEWYRTNLDGKEFLRSLYRKLEERFATNEIITVTPGEYIAGNGHRGIPPHPVATMKTIDWLYPGSWINANFDTWLGEEEENKAWEYLLKTRNDLANCGIHPPKTFPLPEVWEEMLTAEGSDWFWWYGEDQNSPGGDEPFDIAFRRHLTNVYIAANKAGAGLTIPEFPPIITPKEKHKHPPHKQSTMAKSTEPKIQTEEKVHVTFLCHTNGLAESQRIYIAGNRIALGSWVANTVVMEKANGTTWKFETDFFAGEEIQYKYTGGGAQGDWSSEEFPLSHRTFLVPLRDVKEITIEDMFGVFASR